MLLDMTKDKIKKIAINKPNVITRILKSNYVDVYNKINTEYSGDRFTEKLYKYIYDYHNICKSNHCNENTKFISFIKGFSEYCSNKCSTSDTRDVRAKSIKETLQKKYGVNSPTQIPEVKNKIKKLHSDGMYDYTEIERKTKKTKLEKYGDENYNNVKKTKKTKLEKYGDENYNNRELAIKNYNKKYNMNVHPNTLKRTIERVKNNEIGFNSDKFISWLKDNNVENVSQMPSIKKLKKENKRIKSFKRIVNRISTYVNPLFDINTFNGVNYYDNTYEFECRKCNTIFEDHLVSANIPRCPKCYPKNLPISIEEDDFYEYIKNLLPNNDIIRNDRKLLNGLELDIVIPSKKIAFEYNGLYWHSELSGGKGKEYHLNKSLSAKNIGYNLIHILDIDWNYKNDILKRRIKHILGMNTKSIYARNCNIKEIDSPSKSKFLNKYHLQGNDNSQIKLGLFHKNELVSVMTFGNLRTILGKQKKDNHYELYRFASKKNVVGGASKLLNHFVKTYNPNKIITYSKNDWGYSDFYQKIGFTYSHQSPPNYYYFNKKIDNNLHHRSAFQKHKLKDKLKKFDDTLTEWENMQLNGWDRVWDCGNSVYEMKIKKGTLVKESP